MPIEDINVARVRRNAVTGDPNTAIFNAFYGPNHGGVGDLVALNEDYVGYVFFTKPNLNLKKSAIRHIRKLQYLLDDDPNSVACAIKSSLTCSKYWNSVKDGRRSNAVNDLYPFIPFLSNSLDSVSGWPDESVDFFESEEGLAKEVYGWSDTRPDNFGTFDLQLTFNSKIGDPQTAFFSTIREYMGRVGTGEMSPLPISEAEWEIDYNMNVYVLIMDRARKYVQKIASLGGGGVVAGVPTGAAFNIDTKQTRQTETKQISIPMKCYGFQYNDPIIIENFNALVGWTNPDMRPVINGEEQDEMVKLSDSELYYINYRGYPFINPQTSELEWWLEKNVYADFIKDKGVINV